MLVYAPRMLLSPSIKLKKFESAPQPSESPKPQTPATQHACASMGCGSSKPQEQEETPRLKVDDLLHRSRQRMSIGTETAITDVFNKYTVKRRESLAISRPRTISVDEASRDSQLIIGASKKLSKTELRADEVFSGLDDNTFNFLFKVFDPQDTGFVTTGVRSVSTAAVASTVVTLRARCAPQTTL